MNTNKNENWLNNFDNPNYCNKIVKSYKDLNVIVKRNLAYFDELIRTNSKGFSPEEILSKAQRYFPIVSESYTKMLLSFRKLFQDDNLEFNEIRNQLSDLIVSEHRKRNTGINREQNKFLESLGIQAEFGGDFTSSELSVFAHAFFLLDTCRKMMAKLATIFAIYNDEEYEVEGETEEGFQY